MLRSTAIARCSGTDRRGSRAGRAARMCGLAGLLTAGSAGSAMAQCEQWIGSGGAAGVLGDGSVVNALGAWNDGGVKKLVAAGEFEIAGGVQTHGIAAWDGTAWQSLAAGLQASQAVFNAVTVYDGKLVAGGQFGVSFPAGFAASVAVWNGGWERVGWAFDASDEVYALTVFNGQLIAGGSFQIADGTTSVVNVARWDGTTWRKLEGGVSPGPSGPVYALTVYNGELIIAGQFTSVVGVTANNIARWRPGVWDLFGTGVTGAGAKINSLQVHNGDLIAGGVFESASGTSAKNIARWSGGTGGSWHAMGSGMDGEVKTVSSLGTEVFAGGSFATAGGVPAARAAAWDGTAWRAMETGIDGPVRALAAYEGAMIAGGTFGTAGGDEVANLASWDGSEWESVGRAGDSLDNHVQELSTYAGEIIAAGNFTRASGKTANHIARWSASEGWRPLGSGMTASGSAVVFALGEYQGDLIAAGRFDLPFPSIAAWDGTAWHAVAAPGPNGYVYAVGEYNGELIAAGGFNMIGGVAVGKIGAWNGTSWRSLGSGMTESTRWIQAVTVYNGQLIAGGDFRTVEGLPARGVAAWNGTQWSAVGALEGQVVEVNALAVYKGELIAGGVFRGKVRGAEYDHIARWDGTAWRALGGSIDDSFSSNFGVKELTVVGDDLIVGGQFSSADGVPVSNIAAWNGTSWRALGIGTDAKIHALTGHQGMVVAGGFFSSAGGEPSTYWARFGCECRVDLTGDGIVDFADYLEFLNLFDALDPIVDFTGDGIVDFSDYLEFLNLFDAGC